MGKILIFVSIVVMLLTAGLGFVNKGKLRAAKQTAVTADTQIKQAKTALTESQAELKTASETLATTTSEKAALESQVTGLQTAADTAKSEVAKITAEKTALNTQIAQLTTDLQTAKDALTTAQAASPTETASTGPSEETKALLAEKETVITELQSKLSASKSRLEVLEQEKQARVTQIARKSLEGRVLAVNPAWNFVVLSLGDKNGVVNNTELLVRRGTQLVGKVRITSVEPSTSIADIVVNSVPPGTTIAPGDHVLYQVTSEN